MQFPNDLFLPFLYLTIFFLIIKFAIKMLFPHVLYLIMEAIHSHLPKLKEQLFDEGFKQINTGSAKLEILEIGIGTGENFNNYPKGANLTILDKTDEFLPYLEKSIRKNRDDLKISKLIMNHAENMHSIQSNSMDAVVHTFTLCSVKNTDMVLSEIYRVLKPGGVCIFIEHSIDNKVRWHKKILQKLLEPMCGDCSFKDMKKVLERGKYDKLIIKTHEISTILLTFANPMIYGYGKKLID